MFLQSQIFWRLGQCALLRCEHPSALILFSSISWLFFNLAEEFACLARKLCSGDNIPQNWYCSGLNINISLPKNIYFKLGQCALLRCKHPSALIWFLSNFKILFTESNHLQAWPVCFGQVWASFCTYIVPP